MRLKRKDFLKGSLTAIFVWYRLNSCSWILNAAIEYRRTFWPPIYLALNAFVVRMTWTSQQSDGAQALVVRANLRLFRSELSTLHMKRTKPQGWQLWSRWPPSHDHVLSPSFIIFRESWPGWRPRPCGRWSPRPPSSPSSSSSPSLRSPTTMWSRWADYCESIS